MRSCRRICAITFAAGLHFISGETGSDAHRGIALTKPVTSRYKDTRCITLVPGGSSGLPRAGAVPTVHEGKNCRVKIAFGSGTRSPAYL
jgi:hypothetical protein